MAARLPRMTAARPILTVGAALVLLLVFGIARAETPLPAKRDGQWVYDAANVIDAGDEMTMNRLQTELFQKTGVLIVVITVPELVDETIDELAVRAGQDWGVGRKKEDRGIVIAFALKDRTITIATGYGVEGYLPDGRVGGILDDYVIPHLLKNDFSTGLLRASVALAAASAEEYQVSLSGAPERVRASPPSRRRAPSLASKIFGLLVVIAIFIFAVRHPRLFFLLLMTGMFRGGGRGGFGGRGFGGGGGFGGFGGGGFGGGGAGRDF